MADWWLPLDSDWALQDVQAALNVVITTLCALSIFVVSRICWSLGARMVVTRQNVPISSILSVSTLGDVLDIAGLLKWQLFRRAHVKLFAQALAVAVFSAAALLSGPISRYSTRLGQAPRDVSGVTVARGYHSFSQAAVLWNQTFASLDRAGFPYDQLLDYFPDPSYLWLYVPEEWHPKWRMECRETDLTPISLKVVNNCSSTIYSEIPGLDSVIPASPPASDSMYYWVGYYHNGTRLKDGIIFMAAASVTDISNTSGIARAMSLQIAAVHVHDLLLREDGESNCSFAGDHIESSAFSKVDCDLRYQGDDNANATAAYPDVFQPTSFVSNLADYYGVRVNSESVRNIPITTISPRDLIRFYQTWLITKDTQGMEIASRRLTVRDSVVELSIVFLAITLALFTSIVLGLCCDRFYLTVSSRPKLALRAIPQSKLDWLLDSRQIVKSDSEDRISAFENAQYALQQAPTTEAESEPRFAQPEKSLQSCASPSRPRDAKDTHHSGTIVSEAEG